MLPTALFKKGLCPLNPEVFKNETVAWVAMSHPKFRYGHRRFRLYRDLDSSKI